MTERTKPRLCFIGPMAGRYSGQISTPGEFLAEYFNRVGYSVIASSDSPSRYTRLVDMCQTVLRHRNRIDILILSVYVGKSFLIEDIVSRLSRRLGFRVVMVLHNGMMPTFLSLFPAWSNRVLGRADVLIAPSPFLVRAIRPYGFQARVFPNPIDLSQYPFRQRKKITPHLFWMRSFYPYYNPQMAVRVLTRLSRTHPESNLVMAGKDKGMQIEIKHMAEKMGINHKIHFPGFLNHTEKIQAFSAADIFINTNSIDNAPVAILEAWAMGVPIISTAVGGIPDLITSGETGLLVPEDDDHAMTESIQQIVENPELGEKLSSQGRHVVERFAWENVRPHWENLFYELMDTACL